MVIYENAVLGPNFKGVDGDIFINCTIRARSELGVGSVIKNSRFVPYDDNPPSVVGEASVLDGVTQKYATFKSPVINQPVRETVGKGVYHKHCKGAVIYKDGIIEDLDCVSCR